MVTSFSEEYFIILTDHCGVFYVGLFFFFFRLFKLLILDLGLSVILIVPYLFLHKIYMV